MQNIAYKCTWVVSGMSRKRARAARGVEFYQATALKTIFSLKSKSMNFIKFEVFTEPNFFILWVKVLVVGFLENMFFCSSCYLLSIV